MSCTLVHANSDNQNILKKLPKDLAELQYQQVGKTQFSVLFWDIYNSTLYTKTGRYSDINTSSPLVFEIEYLKDITAEDLIQRTIQQWQHLEYSETSYQAFISPLRSIWPDIKSGDKLALLVQNEQSFFYFNNAQIGLVPGKEFSQMFLDIWLSPKTSQPKLRNELLGIPSNE
ncbi:chalcone isomerase family protein [Paraglaciecola sp.]|uniref:chalcone isomerase family protein n=1 Tax=Paraglaciecola sp. TaxID=1920173 RepID=UPI003EF736E1